MSDLDYYQILGISRNASLEEIKSSYRSLAKETHPDLNQGNAESTDKFKLVSEAYEVLSDPQKKAAYDNPNPFQQGGFGEFSFNPFGAGGFFSQFNFSAERPPPPPIPPHGTQRGMNYEVELTVTPFSLLLEHEVTLEYNRMVRCPECNGHGADRNHCPTCEGHGIKREVRVGGHQRQIRDTDCQDCGRTGVVKENVCNSCNGTGLAGLTTTMSLKLRPEFESVIVLKEGGHFGPFGGPAGDLFIRLKIVFPSSDKITEEVRTKLQESYELIYNSPSGD